MRSRGLFGMDVSDVTQRHAFVTSELRTTTAVRPLSRKRERRERAARV